MTTTGPMSSPDEGFPDHSFPNIFVDGIGSFTSGPGVAKLYLVRNEPNFSSNNTHKMKNVLQVVMPTYGLVASFLFLQDQINLMTENGLLSNEQLDLMKKSYDEARNAAKRAEA